MGCGIISQVAILVGLFLKIKKQQNGMIGPLKTFLPILLETQSLSTITTDPSTTKWILEAWSIHFLLSWSFDQYYHWRIFSNLEVQSPNRKKKF